VLFRSRLWWLRGSLTEGRTRLREALAQAQEQSPARAEALRGASTLALRQLDVHEAVELAEEGLAIASLYGELPRARAMVAMANALGSQGDLTRAQGLYADAAARFRTDGYPWELANCLLNMVDLALNRGDLAAAQELAAESLQLARQIGDKVGIIINLGNLGFAGLEQGEVGNAERLFDEGLAVASEVGFREFTAIMLVGLAAAASLRGADLRAAKLLGAAERQLEDAGAVLDSIERRWRDRVEASLLSRMAAPDLAVARDAGRDLRVADAVRLGRSSSELETPQPG